jgi:hypothetical protein
MSWHLGVGHTKLLENPSHSCIFGFKRDSDTFGVRSGSKSMLGTFDTSKGTRSVKTEWLYSQLYIFILDNYPDTT